MSDWRAVRSASLSGLLEEKEKAQRGIISLVALDILDRCGHSGLCKAVPQEIANDRGVYHISRIERALTDLHAYRTEASPDAEGRVLVWDPLTFVAYVPAWLTYDRPRNPKQAVARFKHAARLPDCAPRAEMLVDLWAYVDGKGWAIDRKTFALPKTEADDQTGEASPQQELDLGDQPAAADEPQEASTPAPTQSARIPPPAWQPIVDAYRAELGVYPQPSALEVRQLVSVLDAAWTATPAAAAWSAYFRAVREQCSGQTMLVGDQRLNVRLQVLLRDEIRAHVRDRERTRRKSATPGQATEPA